MIAAVAAAGGRDTRQFDAVRRAEAGGRRSGRGCLSKSVELREFGTGDWRRIGDR